MYKPGTLVLVEARDYFKGAKGGIVTEPQKWCEEGIPVYIADPKLVTKWICVRPPKDKIERLARG